MKETAISFNGASEFFENRVVLVTGGAGFLGRAVVRRIAQTGCHQIIVPRSKEFDLTRESRVQELFKRFQPDVVIHMAALAGSIEFARQHPADQVYQNLMMNTMVMEYARQARVEKFVGIGTACSYPKDASLPLKEEDLWDGYPEETNAPYGMSKKMMLVQSQTYRQQHDFNSINLIQANLYGPGDNADAESSHVIPALIRKCLEATQREEERIVLWGDGSPTREFLYVDDAAEGIMLATARYNESEPVNLGSGIEISIRDLAKLIGSLTGFQGRIEWDTERPNGQPRRCFDTTKAAQLFGFKAKTPLEAGLESTIQGSRYIT